MKSDSEDDGGLRRVCRALMAWIRLAIRLRAQAELLEVFDPEDSGRDDRDIR